MRRDPALPARPLGKNAKKMLKKSPQMAQKWPKMRQKWVKKLLGGDQRLGCRNRGASWG
jgi:hypothetical protein